MKDRMPNDYQRRFFFASNGRFPTTISELDFAAYQLPISAEDSGWRHITASAEYANRVVTALEENNLGEARRHVKEFREEGMQTRGFGKEALTKLQATGLLDELYSGGLNIPETERLAEIRGILEKIQATPRPNILK